MRVKLPAVAPPDYKDCFSMLDVCLRELDPHDPLGLDRHSIELHEGDVV